MTNTNRPTAPTDAAAGDPTVQPLLDDQEFEPGELDELEPTSPPLIGPDGRVRLSYSRIDTYRTCPLQFRFAYIDKLPGKPGPHLSFGTSVHGALEAFYDRTLFGAPSEEDLLQFLYDAWDSTGFAELDRDTQVSWYRKAQDVLRRYHRRAVADYRPAADTEKWFELPVGDTALVVGSIDRVDVDDDGSYHIIDYKTGKLRDRDQVASSLQLAIYALACDHLYGRLPATVSLDFVSAGTEVRVPLEHIDLDRARQIILDTADRILAETYPAEPNRLCGWCDFRALCPAWEGDGPDVLGPAVEELSRLRRRVRRDVRAMRALEQGVARLREGLDDATAQDPAAAPDEQRSDQAS